jgi:hypothetical protein
MTDPTVPRRPYLAATLALLLAGSAGAEGVPKLDHVVVVIMENKSYDQAGNSTTCPYTAGLVSANSSFSNSYGLTHPSQPNYIALWAGSTLGVTNDNCPPAGSPYSVENLGHALETAGRTWRAYSEDLPAAGSAVCTWNGSLYTRKHDPWTDFSNLDHSNERPFGDLATDEAGGTMPDLAVVIPNNCDNSHNTPGCSVTTGDNWLAAHLPAMISAVGNRGLVVLTWDEDDYASDNHILTVFAGPLVRSGYVSTRTITHYTLLRTLCEALRIPPFAAAVAETPITDVWRPELVGVGAASGGELSLGAPAPNPARGAVRLVLRLPAPAISSAGVFDVAGRRVRDLGTTLRGRQSELRWDGRADGGGTVGPGLYLVRVRVKGRLLERRVIRLE